MDREWAITVIVNTMAVLKVILISGRRGAAPTLMGRRVRPGPGLASLLPRPRPSVPAAATGASPALGDDQQSQRGAPGPDA
jgi:hypothetical protein